MTTKLDQQEMCKGYILNYPKIKEHFKEILHENGFFWKKDWARFAPFGSEGVWFNSATKETVRIRWTGSGLMAIIYYPVEIFPKFDLEHIKVEGVDHYSPPRSDYDILEKMETEYRIKVAVGDDNLDGSIQKETVRVPIQEVEKYIIKMLNKKYGFDKQKDVKEIRLDSKIQFIQFEIIRATKDIKEIPKRKRGRPKKEVVP